MEESLKFKDIIQGIMDYYGWTQIEFADFYKISPSQVYRWLNGQSPRADTCMKFINIYNSLKTPKAEVEHGN